MITYNAGPVRNCLLGCFFVIAAMAATQAVAQTPGAPPAAPGTQPATGAPASPAQPPTGATAFQVETEQALKELSDLSVVPPARATTINTLADRLVKLETDSLEEDKALEISFKYGRSTLQQMINSAVILSWTQKVIIAEQEINDVSNLWSNDEFRNTWDKFRDYGVVAGVAAAAAGALIKSDSGQRATVGIGLGVAGVSQLVGTLAGAEKGDKIKTRLVFVEYTRRAYDDLVIRKGMLLGYTKSNADFIVRAREFIKTYNEAKVPKEKADKLIAVEAFFIEFQRILSQMPDYLKALSEAIAHYIDSLKPHRADPRIDTLVKSLEKARDNIGQISKEYEDEVKPILYDGPKILRVIRGQATDGDG